MPVVISWGRSVQSKCAGPGLPAVFLMRCRYRSSALAFLAETLSPRALAFLAETLSPRALAFLAENAVATGSRISCRNAVATGSRISCRNAVATGLRYLAVVNEAG